MSLRDELFQETEGVLDEAAAKLAQGLNRGDPATFKAGYSQENATLAAIEIFPESSAYRIRMINGWDQ